MKVRAAAFAAHIVFCLAVSPVLAATTTITIHNGVDATMTSLRLTGAEFSEFEPVPAGGNVTVQVEGPDGQCEFFVMARFGTFPGQGKISFCHSNELVILPSASGRGVNFISLSQYMASR